MFFIFWRGRGWMVAVLTFVSSLLMELATEAMMKDDTFYQRAAWPLAAALAAAAAAAWVLGTRFNAGAPQEPLARFVGSKAPHSLFTVRMERWAFILGAAAIGVVLYRSTGR